MKDESEEGVLKYYGKAPVQLYEMNAMILC